MKRCGLVCLPMQEQRKVEVAVNQVVVACQDKPGRARMVVRADALTAAAMRVVVDVTEVWVAARRSRCSNSSFPASVVPPKCRWLVVGSNGRPETALNATATVR